MMVGWQMVEVAHQFHRIVQLLIDMWGIAVLKFLLLLFHHMTFLEIQYLCHTVLTDFPVILVD